MQVSGKNDSKGKFKMRKLILFMMTTVDGYIADANDGIDWHVLGEDFGEFSEAQINAVDMLVFGRVTYTGMAEYWTSPTALNDDPEFTAKMNRIPKIVFSKTLPKADWQNTRLIKDDIATAINKLKAESGKDLIIFGSSQLSASLSNLGLIDEYRIMVAPIFLGAGKRLLDGLIQTKKLKLIRTESFKLGTVLMIYEPEN